MKKLFYKIVDGYGECRNISGDGTALLIVIDSAENGSVTIGGAVAELKDGAALFEIDKLNDGVYTPLLSGEIHAELEPIQKQGGKITLMPTSDKTVRRMLARLATAEERLSVISARLDRLSELYGKRVIF